SSPSFAQTPRFTVTAMSTNIYQAPVISSPVIGHSTKGAALDVRGEITDWVEVSWPAAARGVGYVRTAAGSLDKQPALQAAAPTVRRPMTIDEFVHGTSTMAPVSSSIPPSGNPPAPPAGYVADAVATVAAAATARPGASPSHATYV